MRKFILTILIILFSASVIKAEQDFFETSSTLMFTNKKESLKLEIVYNNDENICLYVRYNKPNTTQSKPVTICFWLNSYDGVEQKYIYINTKNGVGSKHTINKSHYNAIASNLHSISVGNKWKFVKKDESHIVREYFINKLTEYKDREVNACKYLIKEIDKENKALNLRITQLSVENSELKTNLQKANETIDKLNAQTIQSLTTNQEITTNTQKNNKSSVNNPPSYTYERTTESERVYPPTDKNGKPRYKYKYKYYRNGKWRYRY